MNSTAAVRPFPATPTRSSGITATGFAQLPALEDVALDGHGAGQLMPASNDPSSNPSPGARPAETALASRRSSSTLALAPEVVDSEVLDTDLANAQRFARQSGGALLFCPERNGWLHFDGGVWRWDESAAIRHAMAVARAIHHEAGDATDKHTRSTLAVHARKSESEQRIRAMASLARAVPNMSVRLDQFDADPWLLCVQNGTVDLRTGQLRPHSRGDLCTKMAPVRFEPEATCDEWDRFLAEIMGRRPALVTFLQRLVGCCLTGDVSAQRLFFFHGQGANGKSTFIKTILSILGEYGKAAASDLLLSRQHEAHPTGMADLKGCRLAVCQEIDSGRKWAEVTVKQLTGGDAIKARHMRQDFFQFTPTHKLLVVGNHKPNVVGTDEGIWRRLTLVPFEVTIPTEKRDPRLDDKLQAETAGIFAWAVRGCLSWQRDGGGSQGLSIPAEVQSATRTYREDEDTVGKFIREKCVSTASAKTFSKALYGAYSGWCVEANEVCLSKKAFGGYLSNRGFESFKTGGDAAWRGIGLRYEGEA